MQIMQASNLSNIYTLQFLQKAVGVREPRGRALGHQGHRRGVTAEPARSCWAERNARGREQGSGPSAQGSHRVGSRDGCRVFTGVQTILFTTCNDSTQRDTLAFAGTITISQYDKNEMELEILLHQPRDCRRPCTGLRGSGSRRRRVRRPRGEQQQQVRTFAVCQSEPINTDLMSAAQRRRGRARCGCASPPSRPRTSRRCSSSTRNRRPPPRAKWRGSCSCRSGPSWCSSATAAGGPSSRPLEAAASNRAKEVQLGQNRCYSLK